MGYPVIPKVFLRPGRILGAESSRGNAVARSAVVRDGENPGSRFSRIWIFGSRLQTELQNTAFQFAGFCVPVCRILQTVLIYRDYKQRLLQREKTHARAGKIPPRIFGGRNRKGQTDPSSGKSRQTSLVDNKNSGDGKKGRPPR